MKKIQLLIIAVLALAVSLPFMLGFEIENRYRGLIAELENSGYRLEQHDYQRGFYRSAADSTFSVPVNTPDGKSFDLRFKIVSKINHGPYNLEDGWLGHLTSFSTEFYYENEPVLADIASDYLTTVINFSGDGRTRIDVPVFSKALELDNNLVLDFKGLQGQIDFNLLQARVDMTAQGDGFLVTAPVEGRLKVGAYQLASASSRGPHDLMLGDGHFKIDTITFADEKNSLSIDVKNVLVKADTSAENDVMALNASYAFDELNVDQDRYGPAILEIGMDSISAEAVARVQESVQEIQRNQVPPQQQGMAMMGVFMSVLPAVLEKNPGFAFKRVEVKTPQGDVKFKLSIRAEDVKVTDVSLPQLLLPKLVGDASMEVPESLVKGFLAQTTRMQIINSHQLQDDSQEALDPVKLEEMVELQTSSQIEMAIRQGFVERKDGQLVSVASLKAGLLSVNGKSIPLPPME